MEAIPEPFNTARLHAVHQSPSTSYFILFLKCICITLLYVLHYHLENYFIFLLYIHVCQFYMTFYAMTYNCVRLFNPLKSSAVIADIPLFCSSL